MTAKPALSRADRKTAVILFVAYAVLFGVLFGLFTYFGVEDAQPVAALPTAIGALCAGLVFSAAMTWFTVSWWRASGSRKLQRDVMRALNGKPVPQNADREEWLRNLRWRLAEQRRWKRWLPAVAVIPLALTVIGAITASSDLTRVLCIGGAVFIVVVATASMATRKRSEQRILDLITVFEEHDSGE